MKVIANVKSFFVPVFHGSVLVASIQLRFLIYSSFYTAARILVHRHVSLRILRTAFSPRPPRTKPKMGSVGCTLR